MGKDFFRIHEVSHLTGFHQNTLKNYERRGYIIPRRNFSNHRIYSLEDVEKLKLMKLGVIPEARSEKQD